ncbi:hypothetical protein MHYP_G00063480 [Metynnis hypsauchen]
MLWWPTQRDMLETCRGFLLQSSLVFEQQPSLFPTERSKVVYMISLLTGRALAWATSLWELNSLDTALEDSSIKAMRTTFHNPIRGKGNGTPPPGPLPSGCLRGLTPATLRILAPLFWELETAIQEAQWQEPDPGGGPRRQATCACSRAATSAAVGVCLAIYGPPRGN